MIESELKRREFLKVSAAGLTGLVIGFHLPGMKRVAYAAEVKALNAWLQIAPDNSVTIFLAKAEMGQNVYTTLPSLIAEELEMDWSKVKVVAAPSQPVFDKFGPFTGGSSSVRGGFEGLRQIGAAAREMLVQAAATRWQVAPEHCYARNGFVYQMENENRFSFGELVEEAAQLKVPERPTLKKPGEFRLIGRSLKRLDSPAKVRGAAEFGIDVKLPDMLCAAVRTSPAFGGQVSNFAEVKAKAPKGVTIVAIPNGVAAVAKSYWVAQNALNHLPVHFSGGAKLSSAQISAGLHEAAEKKSKPVTTVGHTDIQLAEKGKTLSAVYEVPYLAHATMEPMTCVARVEGQKCEIWAGTQSPHFNQIAIGKALNIPPASVDVHTVFLGGGFGRRAEQDFVVQAAVVAKAMKKPVKVIWSREEDMQHDFYRPAFVAHMEGSLDSKGQAVVWKARNAGSSIVARWFPDRLKEAGGHDFTSIEGFKDINYAIANQDIRSAIVPTVAPVGFWRSVGSSQNAFFVESFIDEMAHASGQDPYKFRRRLLRDKPRFVNALDLVADKAGWSHSLLPGHARGIAVAESFGTIVAQVAEVSVENDDIRVHKVTCVYDCGPIVNPDTIEAQMQSGIIFGLSAALFGEITLDHGRVEQASFDTYPILSMAQTPQIDVHRSSSEAPMGGIGEPGTPPIAPAVANAIFAATGKRLRKLPLSRAWREFKA